MDSAATHDRDEQLHEESALRKRLANGPVVTPSNPPLPLTHARQRPPTAASSFNRRPPTGEPSFNPAQGRFFEDNHNRPPDETPATARIPFPSTEKVQLMPEELDAANGLEFVGLLQEVLERSGMTGGQVAAKTGIGRSSVYRLVEKGRTGLPTKPEQVTRFLCGCGLQKRQVISVMRLWDELDAARPAPTGTSSTPIVPAAPAPITTLSPREIVHHMRAKKGTRLTDFAVADITRELAKPRTLAPILLTAAILFSWHYLTTANVVDDVFDMWANWPVLAALELLVATQILRWRLHRTVAPRPRNRSTRT